MVIVIHPLINFKIISAWVSMNFAQSKWDSYFYILVNVSFSALFTMTLERYLALMYPFFHQEFVTKPRLMFFFMLSHLPFGVSYLLYSSDQQHLALKAVSMLYLEVLFLWYVF